MYPVTYQVSKHITTKLTGKIKRSEERAQLYLVRVQRLVYAQHGHELMG